MSLVVEPNLRPPDLGNPKRYVRVDRVPIIDVHRRRVKRKDGEIVEEEVDERQLHRICRNSRERSERGEHGIVFLGHTDDDGPETEQPPIVGYMSGYVVGEYNGAPTILADLYIDKDDDPSKIHKQFPRRSAEVIGINSDDGFIDSVALIKRAPERELGFVTSYHRKHRKVYRYACPACEKETRSMAMPDSTATFKKALELVKHLGEEIVMKAGGSLDHDDHDEHGHHDDSSDDSSDDVSEHFDEPSDESSEEFSMDSSDDSSDDMSDDDYEEPSRMRSRRPTSRRARVKDPADSRQVRELVDPSDDEPSEDMPTDQESMEKRSSPSRKPSEPPQPKESHRDGRLDPGGKMKGSKLGHKKGKKDRYAIGATAGAGMPSDSTVVPAMGSRKVGSSREKKITLPPGNAKMVSRSSSDREVVRMRRDQERTEVSRYERRIGELEETISRLAMANEESEKRARLASIERRVIQLESEGFQLDRTKEVTRLSRVRDKDLDGEIDHMRDHYRRSPVGQPMIPPSMFADVGGNTLSAPIEANPRAAYERETYNPNAGNSAVGHSGKVYGEDVMRFARPRPKAETDYDEGGPIDLAMSAVSRWRSGKTKTNN